ncbi:MAG: CinA family protein [Helicobacteraceae bacterium]|jgi:nicotinamide-nucleotide amidase|nr:CinA family protein [Helicobacteraceae bacterium]
MALNLFGFEPQTALRLCQNTARGFNAALSAKWHIGGWSVLESASDELLTELCRLFYPKGFLDDPFKFIVDRLTVCRRTVTCAESCTGGRLAAHITAIPGASAVFDGSLVTYSNRLKSLWLGVKPETLKFYGAVSAECVCEMALGAVLRTDADYALSVSGIAGPNGGTKTKPVGTVFAAICEKGGAPFSEELRLNGTRAEIQSAAVYNAARLLIDRLIRLRHCKQR